MKTILAILFVLIAVLLVTVRTQQKQIDQLYFRVNRSLRLQGIHDTAFDARDIYGKDGSFVLGGQSNRFGMSPPIRELP